MFAMWRDIHDYFLIGTIMKMQNRKNGRLEELQNMTNRRIYYTAGTVLCLIAASFLVSIFTRPELTLLWPAWVSYVLFALYAIYTVIIFCMPIYKDASLGVCVILAMQLIALGLIMISIGCQLDIGETNWYLPAGLFLTAAANFANLYRVRRNKEKNHR